jgi:hypothetical protein
MGGLALLGFVAAAIAGEREAADLEWRLQPGDLADYRVIAQGRVYEHVGTPDETEMSVAVDLVVRREVVSVTEDGDLVLRTMLRRGVERIGDAVKAIPNDRAPHKQTIAPDGEVLSGEGEPAASGGCDPAWVRRLVERPLRFPHPAAPVRPGDVWEASSSDGCGEVAERYTLTEIADRNGRPIAVISVKVETLRFPDGDGARTALTLDGVYRVAADSGELVDARGRVRLSLWSPVEPAAEGVFPGYVSDTYMTMDYQIERETRRPGGAG